MKIILPLIFFTVLSACPGGMSVEILEKVPVTGMDQPSLKLLEKTSDSCTALMSMGQKSSGGWEVLEVHFDNNTLLVRNKKPTGMSIMMITTPGAKLKFTPCPDNVEKIQVLLN